MANTLLFGGRIFGAAEVPPHSDSVKVQPLVKTNRNTRDLTRIIGK